MLDVAGIKSRHLLLIRLFQLTTSSRVVRPRLNPISGALLKQPDKHKTSSRLFSRPECLKGIADFPGID